MVHGVQVVAARLETGDANALRETVDKLKAKMDKGIVVLATVADEKVRLVAGVTANLTQTLRAGDLVKAIAEIVGGKGGGRPDFAQAGGDQPEKLADALASVPNWIETQLNAVN